MRKFAHVFVLLALVTSCLPVGKLVSAAPMPVLSVGLPEPCFVELPNIYLVVNGVRRHIADWDTFLNLGYTQADIVPCGTAAQDPEGDPITRLFKGATDPVYWLENGLRRHIPDMATFVALGFEVNDITLLPDEVLARWPVGLPLDSILATPTPSNSGIVYKTVVIGNYTIQLWHSAAGLTDFATISETGQPTVTIADVETLGQLPVPDILGTGYPDVLFLTNFPGSHCCSGTVLYELAATPVRVLARYSSGDQLASTGRGEFKDLNGDGHYEFITDAPLNQVACTQPTVTVVLKYSQAASTFVPASPEFAAYYTDQLAALRAKAAASTGTMCEIYPLVATFIVIGQVDEAHTTFNQFYQGSNSNVQWPILLGAIQNSLKRPVLAD